MILRHDQRDATVTFQPPSIGCVSNFTGENRPITSKLVVACSLGTVQVNAAEAS